MAYHTKENTKYNVRKKESNRDKTKTCSCCKNMLNIYTLHITLEILNHNPFSVSDLPL